MTWWLWIVLGLVLAAVELATPGGFFIVFFGVAAVVVGLLDVAGVVAAPWLQWLLFPVLALLALRLFRKPLMKTMGLRDGPDDVDSLVGQVAVPAALIPPGDHGRAELRGAMWQARNVDAIGLAAGQRCRVVAVQGLMLDLRSE